MRTAFKMEDEYITIIRGDTLSFGFELLDENQEPFEDDLASVYFSCKANKTDSGYLFQKSLGDGITYRGNGQYVVRVPPEDTKFADTGKYFYDLQISMNGDVYTILHGILELEQDVTY